MKLILKQSVTHLGEPGDLVEVKRGYARNYLLPNGLAIQATDSNLRAIGQELDKLRAFAAEKRDRARFVAEKLAGVTLTMERKVSDPDNGTLYGSVSIVDIGDALEEAGYDVEKGNIHLENPIKQLGSYEVALSLAHGVKGSVTVTVRSEGGAVEAMQAEEAAREQAEEEARRARAAAAAAEAEAEEGEDGQAGEQAEAGDETESGDETDEGDVAETEAPDEEAEEV